MPGLVGIIGKGPAGALREDLRSMTACMYRRDSFASGTYVDEDRHAYVGWTCHRGSYADCLPVRSASGDATMFFAGEHYGPEGNEEKKAAERFGLSDSRPRSSCRSTSKKANRSFPI